MRPNRADLVALLETLTAAQRDRLVPFRGTPTPMEEMIRVLLGHLDGHARELAEV